MTGLHEASSPTKHMENTLSSINTKIIDMRSFLHFQSDMESNFVFERYTSKTSIRVYFKFKY